MALIGGLIVLVLFASALLGVVMLVVCVVLWLRPASRAIGRTGLRFGAVGFLCGLGVYALLAFANSQSTGDLDLEALLPFGAAGFGWFSEVGIVVGMRRRSSSKAMNGTEVD